MCEYYPMASSSAGIDTSRSAQLPSRSKLSRWTALFADYNARIEHVYVEPPFDRLLEQNKSRNNPVPGHVIEKLAAKSEPPTWTEGHSVIFSDGENH